MSTARNLTIQKLGMLMMANVELAAENATVMQENKKLQETVAKLQAEIDAIKEPKLPLDRPVKGDDLPKAHANGAS